MKNSDVLGREKISTLLFKLSTPIMISMFIQALYNVVDSIFVSRISEEALNAVSIAFPIQNTFIAIAVGTAVGVNANASKSLGEKNKERARAFGENGVFLSLIYSVAFIIFGLFLTEGYVDLQTSDPVIKAHAVEYIRIVSCLAVGIFMAIVVERILQASGKSFYTMVAQTVGAVINIALDPILIFGLFGFPALGVKGAAIATVAGQFASALINILLNQFYNKELAIKSIKPDLEIIREIYKVGLPTIILIFISSFTIFMLNRIVKVFSETAVAMLGIFFKVQSFIFMPLFGLNNGMIPILAYNYGAGNAGRMREVMRKALIVGEIILIFGGLIFILKPEEIFSLFNPSPHMLEIGVPAFKIIGVSFFFTGINMVSGAIFQGLGDGKIALYQIVIRQLVILLPVAYFISKVGTLNNIWYAYIVSEIVGMIFSIYWLKNIALKKAELLSHEN